MNKLRIVLGFLSAVALLVGVHTWVSPKVMDGTARWLRKATGTERSIGEKLGNRLDEFGDTLGGKDSTSKKIRDAGGEIKDTAKKAAKGAGEAIGEASEKIEDAGEAVREKLD